MRVNGEVPVTNKLWPVKTRTCSRVSYRIEIFIHIICWHLPGGQYTLRSISIKKECGFEILHMKSCWKLWRTQLFEVNCDERPLSKWECTLQRPDNLRTPWSNEPYRLAYPKPKIQTCLECQRKEGWQSSLLVLTIGQTDYCLNENPNCFQFWWLDSLVVPAYQFLSWAKRISYRFHRCAETQGMGSDKYAPGQSFLPGLTPNSLVWDLWLKGTVKVPEVKSFGYLLSMTRPNTFSIFIQGT